MSDSSRWRDLTGSEDLRAPFFGFVMKSVLFGMTILQAYQYFMNYPQDSRRRKLIVVTVCGLESVHFGFSAKMMYTSLATYSSKDESMGIIIWCMRVLTTLKTVIIILVQSFYLHLIWVLADNKTIKNKTAMIIKSISVLTFSFTAGACAAFLAYLEQIDEIFSFSMSFSHIIYFSVLSTAFVDCAIAAILSFVLFNAAAQTTHKRSAKVVTHLVLFFIGTGMLNAISKIVIIALYATDPSSALYLAIQFSISSLYVNCLLALFNAKSGLRGKMNATIELRVSSALLFGEVVNEDINLTTLN